MPPNSTSTSLSKEDSKRFVELFEKLDVNKDGKVEVKELATALRSVKGLSDKHVAQHARVNTNIEPYTPQNKHYTCHYTYWLFGNVANNKSSTYDKDIPDVVP